MVDPDGGLQVVASQLEPLPDPLPWLVPAAHGVTFMTLHIEDHLLGGGLMRAVGVTFCSLRYWSYLLHS